MFCRTEQNVGNGKTGDGCRSDDGFCSVAAPFGAAELPEVNGRHAELAAARRYISSANPEIGAARASEWRGVLFAAVVSRGGTAGVQERSWTSPLLFLVSDFPFCGFDTAHA